MSRDKSNFTPRWATTLTALGIAFFATIVGYYTSSSEGDRQARKLFQQESETEIDFTSENIERIFNLTYDSLRTMAMLPGVRKIDRYARDFEGDPRLTVQQLYNNTASHVAVSEIYIVPADIEPDEIDPNTGKLQEPITTFDEIIVGKRADKDHKDEVEMEEVEIHEYREMKKQCAIFRQSYPELTSINGLDWPAISSREVVTCDNTEFSAQDLKNHDDSHRSGIIYSVPFYDLNGKFKGLISAVFRTRVLQKTIQSPYMVLCNPNEKYAVTPANAATEIKPVLGQMSKGILPAGFDFTLQRHLKIKDLNLWYLSSAIPLSTMHGQPANIARQHREKKILFSGILASLLMAGMIHSISNTRSKAIKLANEMTLALRESEEKSRVIVQSALDAIVTLSEDGRITDWNPQAAAMFGASIDEYRQRSFVGTFIAPAYRVRLLELLDPQSQAAGERMELVAIKPDGTQIPVEITLTPINTQKGRAYSVFLHDISARKSAEADRDIAQQKLREASRAAGMAEISTGVLHNVGNVLNSLNVSTSVIADRVRDSRVKNLVKAVELLEQNQSHLAEFLTDDIRGKQLPGYFSKVTSLIAQDHVLIEEELNALLRGVDHIKNIVRLQQDSAKLTAVRERVIPASIMEDAIAVNLTAIGRHQTHIIRDFPDMGSVYIDKHKTLMILVNLINNAKNAVKNNEPAENRKIQVKIEAFSNENQPWLRFQVSDNGVGIGMENIERIFTHGFTTRSDGHGFGLHSSINAAREMGGNLIAQSEGLGCGATFTLEIPLATANEEVSL